MDYIKAIAEVRSISVAAENLGISQPALSAHLKKIEKEFGVRFFDRSKQPLELTEAGKAYLEFADKSASLNSEFRQQLTDIENLRTGSLTVGGASFFNIAYLPKAITTFQKEHPGIDLEVVDGKVPEIVNAAWRGSLDVFITPIIEDEERFHYEELTEERLYLAVPSEYDINESLAAKAADLEEVKKGKIPEALTKEEFESLCSYPFILLKGNQDLGGKMELLFRNFDCRPQHIIRAEQTMTTLAMTLAGAGISVISQGGTGSRDTADKVKLYIADKDLCRRKIYVAYPKNKYLSLAAAKFIDILKDSVK